MQKLKVKDVDNLVIQIAQVNDIGGYDRHTAAIYTNQSKQFTCQDMICKHTAAIYTNQSNSSLDKTGYDKHTDPI